jgi:hypothetical protein
VRCSSCSERPGEDRTRRPHGGSVRQPPSVRVGREQGLCRTRPRRGVGPARTDRAAPTIVATAGLRSGRR